MDSMLALLNRIGSILGWIWANRFDLQVARLMKDLLNEEKYSKRKFETLLHQAAVFDENPNDLRKVLISIGARRYKGADDGECWGFPSRNREEASADPYPFAKFGFAVALIFGIVSSITANFIYDYIYSTDNISVSLQNTTSNMPPKPSTNTTPYGDLLLNTTPDEHTLVEKKYVSTPNSPGVNVRNGPGGSFGVIAILPHLYPIYVNQAEGDWVNIETTLFGSSVSGWIYSKFTTTENPVLEGGKVSIALFAIGDRKINVIKEVRAITGLGLKESKNLVESDGVPIIINTEPEAAKNIKKNLEATGASVLLY